MTRARWFAPLLAAALIGAVFGPSLLHLGGRFLGIEYVDHYGTQWFYWYVEHQLRAGEAMGHTDLYFFPWGKDIFLHTGTNVLDGYLALPFRLLLGPVAGYNAFVLTGLLATGLAFWVLARDYTEDRGVLILATALFTVSPFAMFELVEGRPTQAILALPVFFVFAMLRSGVRRGLLWPLLAGAALAACGYQYWFYAFFGGVVCLGHGAVRFCAPPEEGGSRWRQLGRHVLIAAVAFALASPVAIPLAMAASGEGDVPGLLDVSRWSLQASPPITVEDQTIGLFLWQPFRRYAGFYVVEMGPQERLLAQAILLPWVSLAAMLAALLRPGKLPRGPLLVMALAAALLAMGPIILVGKLGFPNPPYIWLAKSVGFLRRLWWPARATAYLAIIAGLFNIALLRWAARRNVRAFVGVSLVLVVGWGLDLHLAGTLPFPSWDAAIPAGYRCLATGPEGAIMELPYNWTQAHLYYQSAHARPIMGGMLENNPVFTPDEFTDLKDSNGFVKSLLTATMLDPNVPEWAPEDQQAVRDLGYRYVIEQKDAFIHKEHAPGMMDNVLRLRLRNLRALLNQRLGPPVYDDARIAIYAPWGDPVPCGEGDVVPDTEAVGLTEVSADARVVRLPEQQLFRRVWLDPNAYELVDDDGLGASLEEAAPTGAGAERDGAAEDGAEGSGRPLPPSLPQPLEQRLAGAPGTRQAP
jgi:hypothetical protein